MNLRPYITLLKPRIALMVLVTAALGYFLAQGGFDRPWTLLFMLIGTAMAGGGASVLNQYLERDVDARMDRTRKRPLVTGAVSPAAALYYGVSVCMGGCLLLLWQVNLLSAFLALQSAFLYVLVYTPMKRFSLLNTSVGAIPGAMPPLIGWAAADGSLGAGAWALFGILYLWQHPHFYAIAWMYREDYARGGLRMLAVADPDGSRTRRQTLWFSLALLAVSILPVVIGLSGWIYFAGALVLGLFMLAAGMAFGRQLSTASARRVLRASLLYLPLLFLLIVADAAVYRLVVKG